MKKKKVILLAGAAVIVAVAAFAIFSPKKPQPTAVQTATLAQQTLRSTVEASGNVASTDTVYLYAEVSAPIKSVPVKVGDRVTAGQLLAKLDETDLHNTLEQKQIALRTGSETSRQRIDSAEKTYNETKNNLNSGLNQQVNSAKDQVETAQRALDKAVDDRNVNQARVDQDTKNQMVSPQASLSTAKAAYERAEKEYNKAKKEFKDRLSDLKDDLKDAKKDGDKDKISAAQEALDNFEDEEGFVNDTTGAFTSVKALRQAYEDAQLAYNNAQKALNAAQIEADNAATDKMKTYVKAAEDAQIAYNSAAQALKAAETAASQAVDSAEDAVTAEKLAANTESLQSEIRTLNENLEKCTITAPAAGTVTAVYAEENATANGLLFTIEDTQGLQVKVKIKEYDLPSIKEGMKAVVTADATGDAEYEGIVQRIAPAAAGSDSKAAAAGAAAAASTGNNVEFEADVLITTPNTPLRIGMSAKANIITEEKPDVLAVSYDALTTNDKGETVIYTPQKQKDNTYQAMALPVKTGLETDFLVEVSGEGVTAGTPVISEAKSVSPGLLVTITGGASALADAVSGASEEASS